MSAASCAESSARLALGPMTSKRSRLKIYVGCSGRRPPRLGRQNLNARPATALSQKSHNFARLPFFRPQHSSSCNSPRTLHTITMCPSCEPENIANGTNGTSNGHTNGTNGTNGANGMSTVHIIDALLLPRATADFIQEMRTQATPPLRTSRLRACTRTTITHTSRWATS